jgi:hypothetical protein
MTGKLFVILPTGEVVVEEDQPVLALTKKYGCNVIHIIDVDRLVSSVNKAAVAILSEGSVGSGGRMPRKKMSPEERKRRRKELRMAKAQGGNG